jgi:hypothetical protein
MSVEQIDRLIKYYETMPIEINNTKYVDAPVILVLYNSMIIEKLNLETSLSCMMNKLENYYRNIEVCNRNRHSNMYDIFVPFNKVMFAYYNNKEIVAYSEGFYKLKKRNLDSRHDFYIANHDNEQNIFCLFICPKDYDRTQFNKFVDYFLGDN